jgi:hypothetical protein
MAAGATVGPQVVVGAGVRVQAASGAEQLGGPKKIFTNIEKKPLTNSAS